MLVDNALIDEFSALSDVVPTIALLNPFVSLLIKNIKEERAIVGRMKSEGFTQTSTSLLIGIA